ncbi:MAG: sigma-70 family RNA polymerase sigma factor [Bacteroidota bacterium]
MHPPPTAGKQQEFQREALPHSDVLYNYALRMTNNPADADDLLQETFLKAYRFWESYQTGTNIRAWLFRIMKNSFINRYRRESRAPDTVDYEDVKEFIPTIRDPASDGNDLAASMTAGLLDDEVAGALADLPDEFRTVLILCDIEGLTYEEIAEFTDIPLGTVRSRLHRARRLLRGRLLDYARGRGYAPRD